MHNKDVQKAITLLEQALTLLESAGISLRPAKKQAGMRHVETVAHVVEQPA